MINVTGHIFRMVGLLIEMLGVWGVYTASDGQPMTQISLPNGKAMPLAWLWVGLGFVVWLTGTAMVYSTRRCRRAPERDAHQVNLE
jgi:hypothetical protein